MQFCMMFPRFSLRHGRVLAPDQPIRPEASGEVLSCLYYIGCHKCSLKSHSGPFLPTYPSAYSNVSERPTQWVSPLKGPTPPHPPSCTHTLSAQDLVGQKGQREPTGHLAFADLQWKLIALKPWDVDAPPSLKNLQMRHPGNQLLDVIKGCGSSSIKAKANDTGQMKRARHSMDGLKGC